MQIKEVVGLQYVCRSLPRDSLSIAFELKRVY